MATRFVKRDAENNIIVDKIVEPLGAIAYRMRHAYQSVKYTGRVNGLMPGAQYYIRSDGRISIYPPTKTGTTVIAIGIAINRTTLSLDNANSICFDDFIEAP